MHTFSNSSFTSTVSVYKFQSSFCNRLQFTQLMSCIYILILALSTLQITDWTSKSLYLSLHSHLKSFSIYQKFYNLLNICACFFLLLRCQSVTRSFVTTTQIVFKIHISARNQDSIFFFIHTNFFRLFLTYVCQSTAISQHVSHFCTTGSVLKVAVHCTSLLRPHYNRLQFKDLISRFLFIHFGRMLRLDSL